MRVHNHSLYSNYFGNFNIVNEREKTREKETDRQRESEL